ncbi:hypothetical protein HPB50_004337 [Hyalomma asiaticum]|uniref:Uncharacterized protein n=1 Tax=Hyalomma asiaticum TaxID=266040 RepID=A0ACB7SMI7_HYAAI|nr:hypothetical protein HPB50_004337 [Hyalomma asiaticum]
MDVGLIEKDSRETQEKRVVDDALVSLITESVTALLSGKREELATKKKTIQEIRGSPSTTKQTEKGISSEELVLSEVAECLFYHVVRGCGGTSRNVAVNVDSAISDGESAALCCGKYAVSLCNSGTVARTGKWDERQAAPTEGIEAAAKGRRGGERSRLHVHQQRVGCTTGYRSSKKRHALFGVPKDESLSAQWRRATPRSELLHEYYAVHELHFDERYISPHIEHTVDGEIVHMQRGRPVLLTGAVKALNEERSSSGEEEAPEAQARHQS